MTGISFTTLHNQYVNSGQRACLTLRKDDVQFQKRPANCIVRLFYQIFRRISFRAEKSASILIGRATSVIKEGTLKGREGELSSMIKVLHVSKEILNKVKKKPSRRDSATHLATESQLKMDQAATLLAASRHLTTVEFYLSIGLKEEAYLALSNMDDISKIPLEQLAPLLPYAQKNKDYDTLVKLVSRGIPMKDLSREEMHYVAVAATRHSSDEALTSLILSGYAINTPRAELDVLFPSISQGLIKAVKAMLAKKITYTATDSNKNTALHLAFLSGSGAMAQLFIPLIDPRNKNNDGQTPLMMALHPSHNKLFSSPNKKIFLSKVLNPPRSGSEHVVSSRFHERVHELFPGVEFPPCDPVELTYLINDPVLFAHLKKKISRESFIEACQNLAVKYPHKSFERFKWSIFSLTKSHFKTGCSEYKVPKTAPAIPLQSLLEIFGQVNWNDKKFDPLKVAKKIGRGLDPLSSEQMVEWLTINLPQFVSSDRIRRKIIEKVKKNMLQQGDSLEKENAPEYINVMISPLLSSPEVQAKIVKALEGTIRKEAIDLMKEMITLFISNIESEEAITGVPHGEKAKKAFYDQIKREVLYISERLQKTPDPELAYIVLKDFSIAAGQCGGRYFYVAANKYFEVCQGMKETPTSLFLRHLADYRETCLEGAVACLYPQDHNVHGYNLALNDLGKKLGIPGFADAFISEMYTVTGYSHQRVEQKFYDLYTLDSIIDDWLWPSIVHDDTFQKKYIKLLKELMPHAGKEIPSEEQKYEYLSKVIYDENSQQLRKDTLIYLLEKLGIIAADLQWKDSSRKIEPISRSEVTVFRRIQRVWHSLFGREGGNE